MTIETSLSPDFRLESYDYPLPDELIARYPLPERGTSRMMVVDALSESWHHDQFANIGHYLRPGDLVVLNNTKVLPLRLFGNRIGHDQQPTPGKVEVLLLQPAEPDKDDLVWQALVRPAKKLPNGTRIVLPGEYEASITVETLLEEGLALVRLDLGSADTLETLLEAIGQMPIPPYFRREAEAIDKERYQTVFSKVPGSQAAPTAGLHFTPEILQGLRDQGVRIAEVTLTVGIGTFRGVTVADVRQHAMHGEAYQVPEATARQIAETKAAGGRVLAIGTTVAKTLETASRVQGGQMTQGCQGVSELFIYPGFEWQVVDGLLTNFHLPQSTLLMLVSSLTSRELMLSAYQEAARCRYRFYSYGDCMLIKVRG